MAAREQYPVYSSSTSPDPDYNYQQGAVFLVDKPQGWSSFDVVKYIRKAVNNRRVGHTGTLDPMATGLLIVCIGRGTKAVRHYQQQDKQYRATIRLGAATPSLDSETEIEQRVSYDHIDSDLIEMVLEMKFSGELQQIPPMYSAVKHEGVPLYKLARKGKSVKRKPRIIMIYETKILKYDPPQLVLDIRCSMGTYIRSLARDLGQALDSLGYLTALRRTGIGDYRAGDALTIEELSQIGFKS